MLETILHRYEVETNHGAIVIVGTDEADARVMAEKAGFVTYSAKLVETPKPEHQPDYINWCNQMEIEPC